MSDGAFRTLSYASELAWVVGSSWTNTVTVGNGSALLRYRRANGLVVIQIKATLGSTTVIPSGTDAWFFQLPDDVASIGGGMSDTPYTEPGYVPQPMAGLGSLHAKRAGVAAYVGVAVVEPYRNVGGGVVAHPSVRGVLGSGDSNVTSTKPFTWTSGDSLIMSAVVEAFQN